MIVKVFYRHESTGRVDLNMDRKSPEDEVFLAFEPDEGEEQLFESAMIPYTTLVKLMNEYNQMEASLNVIGVETEDDESYA